MECYLLSESEVRGYRKRMLSLWLNNNKGMLWVRKNLVKAKIDKTQKDTLCTLCKKADESIDHVVKGCSKLSQNEYKRRHDNLGKIVHWKLARKYNFEAGDKWYEHDLERV